MSDWLKNGVIYQIYPVSFFDSNGDGIGDLRGITQKLDYVKDLGADIIWLSPIYKSPFQDGGYDVEDYRAIDPRFGTMADFEEMLSAMHAKGIRLLMDLVIGHTAMSHEWFVQSQKKERNAYSDYYIWTNGEKPDGYYDCGAERGGAYLPNYFPYQPKLNYGFAQVTDESYQMRYDDKRLEPLKEEIRSMMRFWLDKGVDGFRVDLAMNMIKCGDEKNAKWFWDKMIPTIKAEYPNCRFLAEFGRPEVSWRCGFDIDYFTHETPGYNELFRFEKGTNILPAFEKGYTYFANAGKGSKRAFEAYVNSLWKEFGEDKLFSIPSGYHDIVRMAEQKSVALMKCVFAFLCTYKCVPQIYYGDEIGMKHDFSVDKDGGGIRTGARTPMQWTEGEQRGFTTSLNAYLPVGKQSGVSVEEQEKDEYSLLHTVKKLLALRKRYPVLGVAGSVEMDEAEYPLCYTRTNGKQKAKIYINPTANSYAVEKVGTIVYAEGCAVEKGRIILPKESFVILSLNE